MAARVTEATSSSASAPGTLAVSTSAARVLVANPRRRSLTIQNTSSETLYVGYGVGLTVANGLALGPGATLVETIYTGAVYAMATAAINVPYVEVG